MLVSIVAPAAAEQCQLLISKWHIYLLKNGRISMVSRFLTVICPELFSWAGRISFSWIHLLNAGGLERA